jgi:cytochrome c oxidase cbb3-type subunit 3
MEFESLTQSADAMRLGASLYASYCTTCHGSDARGAPGYPNLTDDVWIWGNSEQALTMTLKQGRNAVMPALGAALGGDDAIDDMVNYVRSLSGLVEADADAAAMQPKFAALCSACHGMDGKGNQMLGAANLTDDNWLYGSSPEDIRYTLVNGRNGVMPAHGELLGENRTKILAAYVYSLGGGE